jgi:hypothetical protein
MQAVDSRPPVNATLQVTGAVGWRREGLVYKKNEVMFLPSEFLVETSRSKESYLRSNP